MRRRLHVACPDLQAAQQTMNDLLLARIDENHIHVMAKHGAPMDGLYEANLQLVTVLITALGGAMFGAWASSMIGASIPNTRLLAFAKDIEQGKYLMMVNAPYHRVEDIQSLLRQWHPEDEDRGVEPTIPAFP